MWTLQTVYLERAGAERRLDVGPAVTSLLLLMADASRRVDSDEWPRYWRHKFDPYTRLGRNWPREDPVASHVIHDLERAFARRYDLAFDLLRLGKAALALMTAEHRQAVAALNEPRRQFSITRRFAGRPVETIYDHLPEDWAFDFLGKSALIFAVRSAETPLIQRRADRPTPRETRKRPPITRLVGATFLHRFE